jgi:AraC-like DNA-binding protein
MHDTTPRITQHISEIGQWELVTSVPDVRLRGLVRRYQGYVEWVSSGVRRRELPNGDVPLILNFGPPFAIVEADAPGTPRHVSSFMAGLYDRWTIAGSTGPSHCLQVDLTPLGAARVLHQPLGALANQVIPLDALLGPLADDLIERLATAPDWPARFAIIDSFLLTRIVAAPDLDPLVTHAWRRLTATGGQLAVTALAEEVGHSRKHLSVRVRHDLGLPPKTIANVLRFARAVRMAEQPPAGGWAQIAHDCGYVDQSHLIRDVRRFSGSTPSELLARSLGDEGGVIEPPIVSS